MKPVLMDCTIRDGNYAVDFQFTEADTSLIAARLAQLGVGWIEVGHGLGLGAMEAGKGTMPASDQALIRAARQAAGSARIGAFFIPGVGSEEHLRMGRDAGLDFIRLGSDVETLERTFPFAELARKLGYTVCVNMMKTYAVTPQRFGERTRQAVEAGAQIVYCVDSAGCMTPAEVGAYFDAVVCKGHCRLGFHGHNNLMLAVANCLAAYEHGAEFLDTTLCGLGRSAGNAPTEIVVALLEKMGVSTGIDFFPLLDFTEAQVWPLVRRQRAHDMMAVTIGYSSFHSSFLDQVADSAALHQVEVRRLVAEVAAQSLTHLDAESLVRSARALPRTQEAPATGHGLTAVQAPSLSREKISNSLEAVRKLVRSMLVVAAKQPEVRCALHLVPHPEPDTELVVAQLLLQESDGLVARVTFGSYGVLAQVLELASVGTFWYLVEEAGGWAADGWREVLKQIPARRCLQVCSSRLKDSFWLDVLRRARQRVGVDSVLYYGADRQQMDLLQTCPDLVDGACFLSCSPASLGVRLETHADWSSLGLSFALVVCLARPDEVDARALRRAVTPQGHILCLSARLAEALETPRALSVDLDRVYLGALQQLICLEEMLVPLQ